jgi:hypothetical protein
MSHNALPTASNLNTFRNRLAVRIANLALNLIADRGYRALIRGSIEYGLRAAARDIQDGSEMP